jgi:hypothetical protein
VSRLLYFDCFSGISGDMVLGALLDAGLPFDELKRALGTLAVSGYHIHASRVLRAGVSATKFTVHDHESGSDGHEHHHDGGHSHSHDAGHAHRSLPEIFALIDTSALQRGRIAPGSFNGWRRPKRPFIDAVEKVHHSQPGLVTTSSGPCSPRRFGRSIIGAASTGGSGAVRALFLPAPIRS